MGIKYAKLIQNGRKRVNNMGGMSELDLSIRELIFDGTLEENIKENVGTKIKIRDYTHIVSEQDIKDYYYIVDN